LAFTIVSTMGGRRMSTERRIWNRETRTRDDDYIDIRYSALETRFRPPLLAGTNINGVHALPLPAKNGAPGCVRVAREH